MQEAYDFLTTEIKSSLDAFLAMLVFHPDAEQRFFDIVRLECIADGTDKKTAGAFYRKEIRRHGLASVVQERFLAPYQSLEKMLTACEEKPLLDRSTLLQDIISHHILQRPARPFFTYFSDRTPQGIKKLEHAYINLVKKYLCLIPYIKEYQW